MIAIESFEACSNMLSTQKVLIDDEQEAKLKLTSDMKEMEMQCKIDDANVAALLRPYNLLKFFCY